MSVDVEESRETENFDVGLDKLKLIVERMESGGLGLQDSLKLFEEGVGISRRLFEILSQSEGRVEELLADLDRIPFSRGES
ncbi:MAG: exodeoxyribonuclease VII small subunit [Deltaproteobacteria bacterium]|nr:exodeoxyribonuclease VII small subunit [Deltaproteobacteria bacterium]